MRSPTRPAAGRILACASILSIGLTACSDDARSSSREVISEAYTVDRIYRSMQGPMSSVAIVTGNPYAESELTWITGYTAVMVEEDGETPVSQEFMCHSNLDMDLATHDSHFGRMRSGWQRNSRLFTLSQGQQEVHFPDGFGIPVMSDEPLTLTTQVLNLNLEEGMRKVRHRVSLHTLLDSEATEPMKALFSIGAYAMVALGDEPMVFGTTHPSAEQTGSTCLPGEAVEVADDMNSHTSIDSAGRHFSGHFIVKPGRHVYHTLATRQMNVPYDTTVHYVAVHLHPFAESIELKDLTTGETVYKAFAKNFDDKIGLADVDYYSSEEGFPIYRDHEYEVITIYDNTSGTDQDAMAVFRMYALEKDFAPPVATAQK